MGAILRWMTFGGMLLAVALASPPAEQAPRDAAPSSTERPAFATDTQFSPAFADSFETSRLLRIGTAARTALAEGGFTIDARTGRTVRPADAWAVSLSGHERRYPSLPTARQIANYVQSRAATLKQTPALHVGGWHDREAGQYVLDLTVLIADRQQAEQVGRSNGQRAIYHLGTGEEQRLVVR